jgi:hypothetical protein
MATMVDSFSGPTGPVDPVSLAHPGSPVDPVSLAHPGSPVDPVSLAHPVPLDAIDDFASFHHEVDSTYDYESYTNPKPIVTKTESETQITATKYIVLDEATGKFAPTPSTSTPAIPLTDKNSDDEETIGIMSYVPKFLGVSEMSNVYGPFSFNTKVVVHQTNKQTFKFVSKCERMLEKTFPGHQFVFQRLVLVEQSTSEQTILVDDTAMDSMKEPGGFCQIDVFTPVEPFDYKSDLMTIEKEKMAFVRLTSLYIRFKLSIPDIATFIANPTHENVFKLAEPLIKTIQDFKNYRLSENISYVVVVPKKYENVSKYILSGYCLASFGEHQMYSNRPKPYFEELYIFELTKLEVRVNANTWFSNEPYVYSQICKSTMFYDNINFVAIMEAYLPMFSYERSKELAERVQREGIEFELKDSFFCMNENQLAKLNTTFDHKVLEFANVACFKAIETKYFSTSYDTSGHLTEYAQEKPFHKMMICMNYHPLHKYLFCGVYEIDLFPMVIHTNTPSSVDYITRWYETGEPFVVLRNENGHVSHQFAESKEIVDGYGLYCEHADIIGQVAERLGIVSGSYMDHVVTPEAYSKAMCITQDDHFEAVDARKMHLAESKCYTETMDDIVPFELRKLTMFVKDPFEAYLSENPMPLISPTTETGLTSVFKVTDLHEPEPLKSLTDTSKETPRVGSTESLKVKLDANGKLQIVPREPCVISRMKLNVMMTRAAFSTHKTFKWGGDTYCGYNRYKTWNIGRPLIKMVNNIRHHHTGLSAPIIMPSTTPIGPIGGIDSNLKPECTIELMNESVQTASNQACELEQKTTYKERNDATKNIIIEYGMGQSKTVSYNETHKNTVVATKIKVYSKGSYEFDRLPKFDISIYPDGGFQVKCDELGRTQNKHMVMWKGVRTSSGKPAFARLLVPPDARMDTGDSNKFRMNRCHVDKIFEFDQLGDYQCKNPHCNKMGDFVHDADGKVYCSIHTLTTTPCRRLIDVMFESGVIREIPQAFSCIHDKSFAYNAGTDIEIAGFTHRSESCGKGIHAFMDPSQMFSYCFQYTTAHTNVGNQPMVSHLLVNSILYRIPKYDTYHSSVMHMTEAQKPMHDTTPDIPERRSSKVVPYTPEPEPKPEPESKRSKADDLITNTTEHDDAHEGTELLYRDRTTSVNSVRPLLDASSHRSVDITREESEVTNFDDTDDPTKSVEVTEAAVVKRKTWSMGTVMNFIRRRK